MSLDNKVKIERPNEAQLMDGIYRYQRHIYDLTRKFYLLGRDRLIETLQADDNMHVLEIGCGTGRNLIRAARRYPNAHFYGMDISAEMLKTARDNISRAGLDHRIALAVGDATDFDQKQMFAIAAFDRVFFSYSLSMIPDWPHAFARALDATSSSGRLMLVDFGQLQRLPRLARSALMAWLRLFHVHPDPSLLTSARAAANAAKRNFSAQSLYADYCWLAVID